MFEIVPSGTHIDFIGSRRLAIAISLLVLAVSIVAVAVRGVRFGIDFAGGTEVALRFESGQPVDEGVLRGIATSCGVADPTVVRYGETDAPEFLIRFRPLGEGETTDASECPLSDASRRQIEDIDRATAADAGAPGALLVDRLALAIGDTVGPHEVMRVEFVGPRVGDELRRDAIKSLSIAVLLILAYIAFRFSSRFAPGAVVALLHDVAITAGIFAMLGMQFDLQVLAALLAILGYSLNDTIIVYDRIRENMELRTKHDLVDVLNRSVNQTLSRSLLTSMTTLTAVLCLLFVGGEVIRPFALAMAIGIVVGTYSSVFVASPILLYLERRFGEAS